MIASHIEIKIEDKQTIIETLDQKERLRKLNEILLKEIEILTIEQDISTKVKPRSTEIRGNTISASKCAPYRRSWEALRG